MVVMKPWTRPKVSWSTLADGARPVGGAGGVGHHVVVDGVVKIVVDAHDPWSGPRPWPAR